MKSLELLKLGKTKLNNLPSGNTDALELLCITLNKDKVFVLSDINILEEDRLKYFANLEKRLNGEPMQMFYGYTEFLGVKISFNQNTLSPRLETELLADKIIKDINTKKRKIKVLDICSGSGCIGLSIKKYTNQEVVLSDISDFAISHIKENAIYNGLDVRVIKSDMFKNLKDQFDVIVSNPPYLKTEELKDLEKEVELYDPKLALDGGFDGLYFYKVIAQNVNSFLKQNGDLYLEIHHLLGSEIKDLFVNKFEKVEIIKDYSGKDRFVICYNRKEII